MEFSRKYRAVVFLDINQKQIFAWNIVINYKENT